VTESLEFPGKFEKLDAALCDNRDSHCTKKDRFRGELETRNGASGQSGAPSSPEAEFSDERAVFARAESAPTGRQRSLSARASCRNAQDGDNPDLSRVLGIFSGGRGLFLLVPGLQFLPQITQPWFAPEIPTIEKSCGQGFSQKQYATCGPEVFRPPAFVVQCGAEKW
jgi:hypothetical protein